MNLIKIGYGTYICSDTGEVYNSMNRIKMTNSMKFIIPFILGIVTILGLMVL
jgi:hypothetical protein